ncbi:multidrug effflux MFS transporter [Saccharomonospora xinjiangensis]|uniref:multidrug effflux MFS transporter n=1 Tax=Saccharomonospora xinjiangensis TaxID=75294 RepID=UPI00106FA1E4|nr:multidrug effflux MFS transporter [Saccharomonospora xinjiangensis]QBQ59808.1 Bicyclomycin resistance protein [Saccharomonospora xinjiangensis]
MTASTAASETTTAASTPEPVTDRAGTSRPHRTARYALLLGGLTAFGPLSIDMYLPALPVMAQELRSTDTQLQLTLAVFLVGLGIGQLVAGPLSDAFGRRKPLLVGVAVFAAASALAAFSPSVPALIAARAVQALGAATGMVIARAAVRDLYSGVAMARFFSTLMLVTGAAPVLAPVIGGQLLRLTSWRGIFVTLTGFGVLLLVVAAFALPETLSRQNRRSARPGRIARTYATLLRDRVFIGFALTIGLAFAAMFAYISGSSFVLQHDYGLSPSEYGFVFGANGLGLVLVGQINGRLLGRFAPRTLLRTGLVIAVIGGLGIVAAAAWQAPLPLLLAPLFVTVSSVGMVSPNATTLALADHPRSAGSASALLGLVQFLVGGGTSPLVGLLGGSALAMAVAMAAAAIAALSAFASLTRVAPSSDRIDRIDHLT